MNATLKETEAGRKAARLREANVKVWDKEKTRVSEAHRAMIQRQFGIDIAESELAEWLDFSAPSFSIKEFRESAYKALRAIGVREADSESGLQQLLRAGIQNSVNSEYQAVETNYEEIVSVMASNKAIELYAPLFRTGFPSMVEEMDEAPQVSVAGADIQIRNREMAALLQLSKNAIDDDQTGQLQEQAAMLGQNAKILKDSRVFLRWLSKTGSTDAGGGAVAVSATGAQAGESTWPWATAFTNGGGQNRLTSYTAFSYMTVIQLLLLAKQMKDPRGNKMLVKPDGLLTGVGNGFAAHEMLDSDSQFYPSSSAISAVGAGVVGTSSAIGVQHAKNVLKGKLHIVESIWLPDTAYGTMQTGKGFTLQQRKPLEVVMENPLSGPSFSARMFRYLIDERYEVEWREPRFGQLGNDGSVV